MSTRRTGRKATVPMIRLPEGDASVQEIELLIRHSVEGRRSWRLELSHKATHYVLSALSQFAALREEQKVLVHERDQLKLDLEEKEKHIERQNRLAIERNSSRSLAGGASPKNGLNLLEDRGTKIQGPPIQGGAPG